MLNIKGHLIDTTRPLIMGIVNVTPDSFFDGGKYNNQELIHRRIETILSEGANIIDVGACSTRPGADSVSLEEEWQRLSLFFEVQQQYYPNAIVSVDTFRSEIARRCVQQYSVAMINDVSGGEIDTNMFQTIADLNVPYVLSHIKGAPKDMQNEPQYVDVVSEVIDYFSKKISILHQMGVHDIIIDPGFGFGKNLEHNYQMMAHLNKLKIFDLPLLVGISRKSMIYRLLDISPEESLNGTTSLNTIALLNGANILRVHDVRQAVECVMIVDKLINNK